MNKSKTMLFIAPALFSYALAAQACTTLAIQDKQGDIFHGRTLEYMQDLPSWLTYYPAGTQFDKKRRMAARDKLSGEVSDTGHYFHHY